MDTITTTVATTSGEYTTSIIGTPFFIDPVTWGVVNFSIIGIAIIAIILMIVAKEKTLTKVLSILFVIVLPPIGSLFVFGRLLYFHFKMKRLNETAASAA